MNVATAMSPIVCRLCNLNLKLQHTHISLNYSKKQIHKILEFYSPKLWRLLGLALLPLKSNYYSCLPSRIVQTEKSTDFSWSYFTLVK